MELLKAASRMHLVYTDTNIFAMCPGDNFFSLFLETSFLLLHPVSLHRAVDVHVEVQQHNITSTQGHEVSLFS